MIYETTLMTRAAIGGYKSTEFRFGGDNLTISMTVRRTDDVGVSRVLLCLNFDTDEFRRLIREGKLFLELVDEKSREIPNPDAGMKDADA